MARLYFDSEIVKSRQLVFLNIYLTFPIDLRFRRQN